MGLFDKQIQKAQAAYQATMTEADLDEMERKGFDVSSYRIGLAERRSAEAMVAESAANRTNVVNLSRLDPYKATPRDSSTELFVSVAGKPPVFGKEKWASTYQNLPLLYAAVVQANDDLWEPGDNWMRPVVLVFSTDADHYYDTAWLSGMAEELRALKNAPNVPADCERFVKTFRNDQSQFCFPVGSSVAGNVTTWCATFAIQNQAELPQGYLPDNGILPFFLMKPPVENRTVELRSIAGRFYQ